MIRYLSVAEVAELLGTSVNTVKRYAHDNRLPPPDAAVGSRRGWLEQTITDWNASRPGRGARTDLEGTAQSGSPSDT